MCSSLKKPSAANTHALSSLFPASQPVKHISSDPLADCVASVAKRTVHICHQSKFIRATFCVFSDKIEHESNTSITFLQADAHTHALVMLNEGEKFDGAVIIDLAGQGSLYINLIKVRTITRSIWCYYHVSFIRR